MKALLRSFIVIFNQEKLIREGVANNDFKYDITDIRLYLIQYNFSLLRDRTVSMRKVPTEKIDKPSQSPRFPPISEMRSTGLMTYSSYVGL